MSKLSLSSYYIILFLFCQVSLLSPLPSAHAETPEISEVSETSETSENSETPEASTNPETSKDSESPKTSESLSSAQKTALSANCAAIKDTLKNLQKDDSHARVYLGGRFEKINSKFIIPMNTRLTENNLSTPELVENQNRITESKATFVSDFVDYQRELEALISQDCKTEPDKFYAQLEKVRAKRQLVADDVSKTHSLADGHIKLLTALKEKSS